MKGAPRKLRKSCSLPTCCRTPGECMHCTCDGRCGQHAAGRCGVRREGNGKSCKREGCLRDESCLHSTRATCCHCRNLVSSSNRTSRKRTRADAAAVPVVTVATTPLVALMEMKEEMEEETMEEREENKEDEKNKATTKTKTKTEEEEGAASPTSCDALLPLSAAELFGDFEICEELLVVTKKQRTEALTLEDLDELQGDKLLLVEQFITPSMELPTEEELEEPEPESGAVEMEDDASTRAAKSLSEYEAYALRRAACNLVVVVEGVQLNLHKHPMLLESQLLNAKARESVVTDPSPVPVVRLPVFPGGVETFEALCVYAYTGELSLTVDTIASVFCGVQFLNMGFAISTMTRDFLTSITSAQSGDAAAVASLLHVTRDAQTLMVKHDALAVCQQLQLECVDALARVLPLVTEAVDQLLSLPIELFLQVTQEMLATRGPRELAVDTVRQLCVQAELAQLHREALNAVEETTKKETEEEVDVTEETRRSVVDKCLALLERSLASDGSTAGFRSSSGRLATVVAGVAGNEEEEDDDALFMKMMGEFEMDAVSEDELIGDGPVVGSSSSFMDALAVEPFAFSSRLDSRRHRLVPSAFAV